VGSRGELKGLVQGRDVGKARGETADFGLERVLNEWCGRVRGVGRERFLCGKGVSTLAL